jgi:predicted HTH transcriptional regulator
MWCFENSNKALERKDMQYIGFKPDNWSGNWKLDCEISLEETSDFDDDILNAILEQNPRQTTRELVERLNTSQTTVHQHLENLGEVSKIRHMGIT